MPFWNSDMDTVRLRLSSMMRNARDSAIIDDVPRRAKAWRTLLMMAVTSAASALSGSELCPGSVVRARVSGKHRRRRTGEGTGTPPHLLRRHARSGCAQAVVGQQAVHLHLLLVRIRHVALCAGTVVAESLHQIQRLAGAQVVQQAQQRARHCAGAPVAVVAVDVQLLTGLQVRDQVEHERDQLLVIGHRGTIVWTTRDTTTQVQRKSQCARHRCRATCAVRARGNVPGMGRWMKERGSRWGKRPRP